MFVRKISPDSAALATSTAHDPEFCDLPGELTINRDDTIAEAVDIIIDTLKAIVGI